MKSTHKQSFWYRRAVPVIAEKVKDAKARKLGRAETIALIDAACPYDKDSEWGLLPWKEARDDAIKRAFPAKDHEARLF